MAISSQALVASPVQASRAASSHDADLRLTFARGAAITLVLVVDVLVVLLLTGAGAVPRAVGSGPGPMPSPAPAAMDFPEQARPGQACAAIIAISSAGEAPRAAPADELTSTLFEDACFGA